MTARLNIGLSRAVLAACRLPVVISAVMIAVSSCRRPQEPDTAASEAAQFYYDRLLAGDCETFVSGMHFSDAIPDDYRRRLVVNTRMFMAGQREEHDGIAAAEVLRQENDSANAGVNVFVVLTYNDSTKEEIVVPMVLSGETWLMR